MQAQRTYRPDTVSVSGYDVNATQDTLWKWWSYGDAVQFDAPSFAASIPLRQALKNRTAKLKAFKRPGRILIVATL